MRIGYLDPDKANKLCGCAEPLLRGEQRHSCTPRHNQPAGESRGVLACCDIVIDSPFRSTYRCARWDGLPTGHTDVNYSFSGVVLLELQFQFLQRVELRLGDDLPVEEEREEVNGCEDRVRTSATDGRHERWENNGYKRVG